MENGRFFLVCCCFVCVLFRCFFVVRSSCAIVARVVLSELFECCEVVLGILCECYEVVWMLRRNDWGLFFV